MPRSVARSRAFVRRSRLDRRSVGGRLASPVAHWPRADADALGWCTASEVGLEAPPQRERYVLDQASAISQRTRRRRAKVDADRALFQKPSVVGRSRSAQLPLNWNANRCRRRTPNLQPPYPGRQRLARVGPRGFDQVTTIVIESLIPFVVASNLRSTTIRPIPDNERCRDFFRQLFR